MAIREIIKHTRYIYITMTSLFQETSRFAVCNLDWDRVKAADIMILLSSFCPRGGSVRQVTIYPSEYGKKRMAEEERLGPLELRETKGTCPDWDLVDLEKLEKGLQLV